VSVVVFLRCDGCGDETKALPGRIESLRALAAREGWTGGYINKPYDGKRADFCPTCSRERAKAKR
jgi:hypothetical protein